jgi:hypothetical protein
LQPTDFLTLFVTFYIGKGIMFRVYSIIYVIFLLQLVSQISAFHVHTQRVPSIRSVTKNGKTLYKLYSEFERSGPPKPAVKEVVNDANVPATTEEDEEEQERQLSEAMKRKLRNELRAQGADPNYSAGPILGNPILIISGILVVLILAGGKGIFF